jgi:hypothetical protein
MTDTDTTTEFTEVEVGALRRALGQLPYSGFLLGMQPPRTVADVVTILGQFRDRLEQETARHNRTEEELAALRRTIDGGRNLMALLLADPDTKAQTTPAG